MDKLKLLNLFTKALPLIKMAIFSDGKFKPKRALVMLAFFIILLYSIEHYGAATVEIAITFLDSISDQIGYGN